MSSKSINSKRVFVFKTESSFNFKLIFKRSLLLSVSGLEPNPEILIIPVLVLGLAVNVHPWVVSVVSRTCSGIENKFVSYLNEKSMAWISSVLSIVKGIEMIFPLFPVRFSEIETNLPLLKSSFLIVNKACSLSNIPKLGELRFK